MPIVTLKVNGVDAPIVTSTGPMNLTLSISPSTWTTSLAWYWSIAVGPTTVWVTSSGISATPAPLITAVPPALTDVTLLNIALPPGTSLTNTFLLVDGVTTIGSDSITTNVE